MPGEMRKPFLSGFLAGMFFCLVLAAGLLAAGTVWGLPVHMDLGAMSREVTGWIEQETSEGWVLMRDALEEEVPGLVAEEIVQRVAAMDLVIHGVRIQVPEDAMGELREMTEDAVAVGLRSSLRAAEMEGRIQSWVRRGQGRALAYLQGALEGESLVLRLHPRLQWPAIPIRVHTS